MSSAQNAEPTGFFSLPRELRDEIYDMLHLIEESADFGAKKQLKIRYPYPRLHQISRQFATEYHTRPAPERLVVVSQKHWDFNPFTARVRFPRIVHIRHMQTRRPIQKLHINLHIPDDSEVYLVFQRRLRERLTWAVEFVQKNCSRVKADNVCIRLMIDSVITSRAIMNELANTRWSTKVRVFGGTFELLMENSGSRDEDGPNFESAMRLAVSTPDSGRWEFDKQVLKRCGWLSSS